MGTGRLGPNPSADCDALANERQRVPVPISPQAAELSGVHAFMQMRRISKTRALQISLLAIVSVIILEGVADTPAGSLALLSDAGHAAFDALSTLILLIATPVALKPADEDHAYGHGKIESLGALIGGITLLVSYPINVHCLFSGDAPISEIHEMISRIAASVRQKFDNAVVTIHPESVRR